MDWINSNKDLIKELLEEKLKKMTLVYQNSKDTDFRTDLQANINLINRCLLELEKGSVNPLDLEKLSITKDLVIDSSAKVSNSILAKIPIKSFQSMPMNIRYLCSYILYFSSSYATFLSKRYLDISYSITNGLTNTYSQLDKLISNINLLEENYIKKNSLKKSTTVGFSDHSLLTKLGNYITSEEHSLTQESLDFFTNLDEFIAQILEEIHLSPVLINQFKRPIHFSSSDHPFQGKTGFALLQEISEFCEEFINEVQ